MTYRVLLLSPFHDHETTILRVERLLEVGDGVLEPPHHELRDKTRDETCRSTRTNKLVNSLPTFATL